MRRLLVGFLILGLMAGSVGMAEAQQRPAPRGASSRRVERTVQRDYGPYPAPVTGCNSALSYYACALIRTRTKEAFFTGKVTDVHGQPVYVEVEFWCGGYGTWYGTQCAPDAHFCGRTSTPIRFPPDAILAVYVGLPNSGLPAQTTCPANSVKTTGTISVTLSNRR
jgi:hypothetical protein